MAILRGILVVYILVSLGHSSANTCDLAFKDGENADYLMFESPIRNEKAIQIFYKEVDSRMIKSNTSHQPSTPMLTDIIRLIEVDLKRPLETKQRSALASLWVSMERDTQNSLTNIFIEASQKERSKLAKIFIDGIERIDHEESFSAVGRSVFLPAMIGAFIFDVPVLVGLFASIVSSGTTKTATWQEFNPKFESFYDVLNTAVSKYQKKASAYVEEKLDVFFNAGATTSDITSLLSQFSFYPTTFERIFSRGISRVQNSEDFLILFGLSRSYGKEELREVKHKYLELYWDFLVHELRPSMGELKSILAFTVSSQKEAIDYLGRAFPLFTNKEVSEVFRKPKEQGYKSFNKKVVKQLGDKIISRSSEMTFDQLFLLTQRSPDLSFTTELRQALILSSESNLHLKEALTTAKFDTQSSSQKKAIGKHGLIVANSLIESIDRWHELGVSFNDGLSLLSTLRTHFKLDTKEKSFDPIWLAVLELVTTRDQLTTFKGSAGFTFKLRNRSTISAKNAGISD